MAWMIPGLVSSQPVGHLSHAYEVFYGHSHRMSWMTPGLTDDAREHRRDDPRGDDGGESAVVRAPRVMLATSCDGS
jgi:hypothetical protein